MKARYLVLATLLTGGYVQADDSTGHSGKASKHSAIAASQGTAVSVAVGSAVMASPIVISGAAVSAAHEASHKQDTPNRLVITETVITVDAAPNVAITARQTDKKE
ncbi:hypothetical protein [Alteromonas sp. H39]|uniref:hypothetical protein n=1 Tax=Alteromonas sp. H39 TaxID=3389876 RepID=UPI0039E08457